MKKLVIAGGTGFIGRSLVDAAVARDFDVCVLTRSAAVESPVRTVQWDGCTAGDWTSELADADTVVNLCGASIGEGRWSQARKREILSSRLEPAKCLVEQMARLPKLPKYIQASAVGFYGVGDEPVDETSAPGNDYLAHLAIEWEAAAADYSGPVILPRFGVVLDKQGGALPKMVLPFQLFAGGPLGDGRQWFSWVTLTDAVEALLFLIEGDLTGPVNVVAPNLVTNRELSQAIGATLKRPALLPTPAFALKLLLGEQSALLLEGQRVVPKHLTRANFEFVHPDIASALRDIYP